jgi:hypothetical protein
MRHPKSPDKLGGAFPTAGNNEVVILYDDGMSSVGRPAPSPSDSQVRVAMMLDRVVTFIIKWAPQREALDAALGIINGATQTGEATVASTFFARNVILQPGRNQISVVMGATAPTANYIAVETNTSESIVQ